MNLDRYSRQVELQCPVCGSTSFHSEESEFEEKFSCLSCGHKSTRDALIEANQENLSQHIEEVKEEIVEHVSRDLQAQLRRAFRGNKFVKFK